MKKKDDTTYSLGDPIICFPRQGKLRISVKIAPSRIRGNELLSAA